MSDCENRHSSSPSRHSREGGNPQAFTAEYAEERRGKTLTTEAQRHRGFLGSWHDVSLGEIAQIRYGHTAKSSVLFDGPKYLRITDIQNSYVDWGLVPSCPQIKDTLQKFILKRGDIVFARTGATTGKSYLIEDCPEAVFASYLIRVQPNQKVINPHFVQKYFLTAKYWNAIGLGTSGNAQGGFNASKLTQLNIPLPPLNEQKRIVAKIEALQARSKAARDALAEVPKLVEQFKQSVLAAAFRGDLTKTWREQHPDVEPAEQLLARIRTERRTKWEADQLAAYEAKNKTPPKNWQSRYKEPVSIDTSNLPDLPESWCWASLGEATVKVQDGNYGGSYPKKNEWTETGVPFLTPAAIREDGAIDDSLVKHVSVEKNAKLTKAQLKKGDIIFPNRGSREAQVNGKQPFAIQVPSFYSDGNINPQLTLVRLMPKLLSPLYVCLAMNAPVFLQEIRSLTRGGALRFINLTQSCKLPIPIISLEEQHQITQRIESLFAYADSILEQAKASLAELDQLDQSILAKAFRGELVPQDPNDEPASVLLERIKAERAKVTPVKKSRKKAMA